MADLTTRGYTLKVRAPRAFDRLWPALTGFDQRSWSKRGRRASTRFDWVPRAWQDHAPLAPGDATAHHGWVLHAAPPLDAESRRMARPPPRLPLLAEAAQV